MAVVINTVTSTDKLSLINANFSTLAAAINNSLLWRNGTTTGETLLTRDVDFNGQSILNAYVGGVALSSLVSDVQEQVDVAEGYAEAAQTSATSAASSASSAAASAVQAQAIVDAAEQQLLYYVTPLMFGAVGDGVTDDTAAFAAAIAVGSTVFVTKGTYKLSLNTLSLPSNTKIVFDKSAEITVTNTISTSAANQDAWVFKCGGTSTASVSNIQIDGGSFVSADDRIVLLAVNSYATDILLRGCTVTGMRAIHVLDGTGAYASSTSTTRPKRIRVEDITGTSGTQSTVNAFLQYNFVEDFSIDHVYCYGYYFGVQFWGGNSDPASNGAVANERKCITGSINDVTAFVVEAGIWGSMARGVEVTNSYVEAITTTGSDVGFDFEGCFQCSASNGTAKNFLNGCIATFFYCQQVVFDGINIVCTNSTARAGRFNNTAQDLNSKDILVVNCQVRGEGFVTAITQNGSSDNIQMKNNSFINCLVYLIANNNGHHTVQGNTFYFDVVPTLTLNAYSVYAALQVGAFHGVSGVGGRKVTIVDNTFRSTVTWPTLSAPIFSVHTSTSFSTFTDIRGGAVLSSGWTNDFIISNAGTSTSVAHRWQVRDFQVYTGVYQTSLLSSATVYPQGLIYAKDQFGRPWPVTAPTGVYLQAGQKIDYLAPTAGGFIGIVVTTGGYDSAAVTKTYGAISS